MDNTSLSLQIQKPTAAPPPPQPQTAMLHSVDEPPPAEPWKRPKPPPPRVYHVEPRGFRKLVQKLTGAPKRTAQPRPLRDTLVQTNNYKPVMPRVPSPWLCSPYGRWCSFPLLSPGTMASLELSINSPIL